MVRAGTPGVRSLVWRCDLVAITFDGNGYPEFDHFINAIVTG
jgi:hypothetical protein